MREIDDIMIDVINKKEITSDEQHALDLWYNQASNKKAFILLQQIRAAILTQQCNNDFRKNGVWNRLTFEPNRQRREYRRFGWAAAIILLIGVGSTLLLNRLSHSYLQTPEQITVNTIIPGQSKAILITGQGARIPLKGTPNLDSIINTMPAELFEESSHTEFSQQNHMVVVPRGGEYRVTLSDGTEVILNSDSKLTFPNKFDSRIRKVTLSGEAFFRVASNKAVPFVILTGDNEIHVLGTSFNLTSYPEDQEIRTTLVEGKVEFHISDSMTQLLAPGEQLIYNKQSCKTMLRNVDTRLYCNWIHGDLFFEEETLEAIMTKLARWYDIEVIYESPKAKELVFSGELKRYDRFEKILDIISMTTNIRFTIQNKRVLINIY